MNEIDEVVVMAMDDVMETAERLFGEHVQFVVRKEGPSGYVAAIITRESHPTFRAGTFLIEDRAASANEAFEDLWAHLRRIPDGADIRLPCRSATHLREKA